MGEAEKSLVTTIAEGAANLPAPVKTGLIQAVSQLIGGLVAIPAAWARRPAQAFDDVTTGRSIAAAVLAKGVAEHALEDPMLLQAATEVYLPTHVRKARNRVLIAQRTVEHVAGGSIDESAGAAAPPDDDWMNTFMRFAEDASSERLQDLFAKILAGEVIRRGSFGLATLRAVSEMDRTIAEDFSATWAKSVGEAVDYAAEFVRGEWYARWQRLAEAGLVKADTTVQYLPPYNPVLGQLALWQPMAAGGVALLIQFSQGCSAKWKHIPFTRVGREIGSLLPRPDYEANMRLVGKKLSGAGVVQVALLSHGQPIEVIATSDQT